MVCLYSAGSQRCEVLEQASVQARELKWRVRIIADIATPRVPLEVSTHDCAHLGAWAWRVSDAWALSDMAGKLFADIAPEVRLLRVTALPEAFSAMVALCPCLRRLLRNIWSSSCSH